ncbi:MAG: hypothetical protein NVS3B25_07380 [Hymenobacter sp.]
MCLGSGAARRIAADLHRYPLVVREAQRLRAAVGAYAAGAGALHRELAAKDTVIAATTRRVVVAQALERDADGRATVWHQKARKRWYLLVAETALLLGGLVLSARR